MAKNGMVNSKRFVGVHLYALERRWSLGRKQSALNPGAKKPGTKTITINRSVKDKNHANKKARIAGLFTS